MKLIPEIIRKIGKSTRTLYDITGNMLCKSTSSLKGYSIGSKFRNNLESKNSCDLLKILFKQDINNNIEIRTNRRRNVYLIDYYSGFFEAKKELPNPLQKYKNKIAVLKLMDDVAFIEVGDIIILLPIELSAKVNNILNISNTLYRKQSNRIYMQQKEVGNIAGFATRTVGVGYKP